MLRTPKTTAVRKKGRRFADLKISNTMRKDYEEYLMGQTKITYVAKLRKKTEYEITRAFNILFHEKLDNHKNTIRP